MLIQQESKRHGSHVTMTVAVFVLLIALLPYRIASAGNVWLPDLGSGRNVGVSSLHERKFETIIRQQFDFSCGSAALATLLTYHYEDPTTEQSAFAAMYELGDQQKIREFGFSLLDIKEFLATRGYQADGYKASLEALAAAGVPAIALINVQGYKHFVVVKGLNKSEVLVGDPALGLRFMPAESFSAMWENRILFIIRNRSEIGRENFNVDKEWQLLARAPLGDAVSRETLESLTISLPQINDFTT